MIFKEGEYYKFKILNQIEVPNKGLNFVIQHESGRKILLFSEYYVNYKFDIGAFIDCRVDKINCTGQIFLEPKHPFYEIGKRYNFSVVDYKVKEQAQLVNLEVLDVFHNRVQLFLPYDIQINDSVIQLVVTGIKKGKPILSLVEIISSSDRNFRVNEYLNLFVTEIITLNNEEFFKLKAKNNQISLLKVKHYQKYGIEVGKSISCQYLGTLPDGTLKIEPTNPYYNIGDVYSFNIESIQNVNDLETESLIIAELIDITGKKCGVKLPNDKYTNGQKIQCRITGYRKGRPQLEIVL